MMMTASELQTLLNVPDNTSILYGYTFERDTLVVFFQDEKLVRVTYNNRDNCEVRFWHESEFALSEFWGCNVKRWYPNGTNDTLRKLVAAFGNGLNETNCGGSVPAGSPVYFDKPGCTIPSWNTVSECYVN